MKKFMIGVSWLCGLAAVLFWNLPVAAAETDTVKEGIYAGDISLAGMTKDEAETAVLEYVDLLAPTEITLIAADNNEVVVTAGDLGISWGNPEILDEAMTLGTQGNIVQRYKAIKDLEHENKIYPIELDFDIMAIDTVLAEQCSEYDREAVDMGLVRENNVFQVKEGQTGYFLDVENSIDTIYAYLTKEWNHEACSIPLDIVVSEPRGTAEQLLMVEDVLGTFSTSYATSGQSRSANVENGSRLINGITLYPGDEFSTYETVAPFSEKNGYYMAGSYLNGKVVDSLGGGICQVSTTLYNAVLLAELDVTERYNHSMIVNYVEPSADAAIAESSGKDFKFVNNTDYPIYIESYTTSDKQVVFNIYGVETRDANRTVEYVSEVLEVINPTTDNITADAAQPIGYITVSSAHIGYKARLWKVVKENGVEVSREVINSSKYKMVPRSAVVGVSTADPNAYNEMMAAIGTGSIDHVKNVIALLQAAQAQPQPDAGAAPVQ
ncbi:MAG: VanW family protein [Lachnospiraceae bacterium]|nr:VanW family protein [Lachnospiraceae bacterium]